jgi:ComF family protein
MPQLGFLSRVREACLDLLFPRDCMLTGVPVDNPPWRYLSPAALQSLPRVQAPFCDTCGYPFSGMLAGARRCSHCEELDPAFGRGRTAMLAKGNARSLIIDLKYHKAVWLAEDLARLIATTPGYPEHLRGAVLVPVPLHPRRERWRGYNQSRLVLEKLVRLLPQDNLALADILVRTRDTPTQTRLDRAHRATNIKGAFALRAGAVPDLARRHVVFDDVFTTGATLNACCMVLADAGVTTVDIASLAHG